MILFVMVLAGCSPAVVTQVAPTVAEQPTAATLPTLTVAPTATTPVVGEADMAAFEQNRRLGRGVNFGNALEAPVEGEWGMVIEEGYFDLVKQAGLNSLRIPTRWTSHVGSE